MRTRPVGDRALLVLVESPREAVAVRRLVLELSGAGRVASGLAAPVDVVPAARTVLLDGLPDAAAVEAWRSRLTAASVEVPALARGDTEGGRDERLVTIDVRYGGPDLEVVAQAWSCSPDEVVARHQQTTFMVAFCGFAPGFAYCVPTVGLPVVPRRDEPRTRVPAGSVALAGEYCGVYPAAMPGGWQVIGSTTAVLFDAEREEPALLTPGVTVRFRSST